MANRKPKLPDIIRACNLREPIALTRSIKTPDEASGFLTELVPYRDEWAMVVEGERTFVGKEDADDKATHCFVIRKDITLVIEARDSIIWMDVLYRPIGTLAHTDKAYKAFLLIFAVIDKPVTDLLEGSIDASPGVDNEVSGLNNNAFRFFDE